MEGPGLWQKELRVWKKKGKEEPSVGGRGVQWPRKPQQWAEMLRVERRGRGGRMQWRQRDIPDAWCVVWYGGRGGKLPTATYTSGAHSGMSLGPSVWHLCWAWTGTCSYVKGTNVHDINLESPRGGSVMPGSLFWGGREVDNLSEKGCHQNCAAGHLTAPNPSFLA